MEGWGARSSRTGNMPRHLPGQGHCHCQGRAGGQGQGKRRSQSGAEQQQQNSGMCVLNFSFVRKFHSIDSRGVWGVGGVRLFLFMSLAEFSWNQ